MSWAHSLTNTIAQVNQAEAKAIGCVDGVKSIDLGCFKDDSRNRVFDNFNTKEQLNLTPEVS